MVVMKGLQGPITVKGQQFGSAVMQPWESLGDQKVADVLTFERQEWGNHGSRVTKEQIAADYKQIQDEICAALEFTDGDARFEEELWERDGGGGGRPDEIGILGRDGRKTDE